MRPDEPIALGLSFVRRLASGDPEALGDRVATIAAIQELCEALDARPSGTSTSTLRARLGALLAALRAEGTDGSAVPRELIDAARACLRPVPLPSSTRAPVPGELARPIERARAVVGAGVHDDAYAGALTLEVLRATVDLRDTTGALLVFALDVHGEVIAFSGGMRPQWLKHVYRVAEKLTEQLLAGAPRASVVDADGSGVHIERIGGLLLIAVFDARCRNLALRARATRHRLARAFRARGPLPPFDARLLEELFVLDDGRPTTTS